MPTLKEVKQQIAKLPHKYIFYTRKEIRYLPQILGQNEHIYALTSGFMNGHTWLLVCTSKRVLFLNRGWIYGLQQVQMNLDRIQAIESNTGLMFGTVRMWDSASAVSVNMILRSSVAPFVRTTQEAMDIYKRHMVADMVQVATGVAAAQGARTAQAQQPMAQPGPASSLPWVGELERLSKMKADGLLTEQEFAVAKAKLLGGH